MRTTKHTNRCIKLLALVARFPFLADLCIKGSFAGNLGVRQLGRRHARIEHLEELYRLPRLNKLRAQGFILGLFAIEYNEANELGTASNTSGRAASI